MGIDLNRLRGGRQSKEWLEWLSDDPLPPAVRSRMQEDATKRAVKAKADKRIQDVKKAEKAAQTHSVSIHISVPSLKWFDVRGRVGKAVTFVGVKLKGLSQRNKVILSAAGAVVVAGIVMGVLWVSMGTGKPKEGTGVLGTEDEKPNFSYNLPTAKNHTIKPEDIRYDAKRKVVNFKDTVGGVEVTVSQQPLPESLKEDTDNKVKKLAEGFSANDALTTANPTAYLGTSIKGPQTVIFAKNNVLVFIQSVNNIDKTDWAEYVTRLNVK